MSQLNNLSKLSRFSLNLTLRPSSIGCSSCKFHHSPVSENEKAIADSETHTGQRWHSDDIRMARFLVSPKQVNPNWSVNLIQKVPSIPVKSRIAVCDGGPSEALGHPKIYINLHTRFRALKRERKRHHVDIIYKADEAGPKSCIYCGQTFHKVSSH